MGSLFAGKQLIKRFLEVDLIISALQDMRVRNNYFCHTLSEKYVRYLINYKHYFQTVAGGSLLILDLETQLVRMIAVDTLISVMRTRSVCIYALKFKLNI